MADATPPASEQHTLPVIPDGAYAVDVAQTRVSFRAKAFGLIWVRGRLPVSAGQVRVQGGRIRGRGTLAADRIDTGLGARDWHLRTSHYLHTTANPELEVLVEGDPSSGAVNCEVVVRGKPGRVELAVRAIDVAEDGLRIEAGGTLDRTPFRMLRPLAGVSRRIEVDVTLIAHRGTGS